MVQIGRLTAQMNTLHKRNIVVLFTPWLKIRSLSYHVECWYIALMSVRSRKRWKIPFRSANWLGNGWCGLLKNEANLPESYSDLSASYWELSEAILTRVAATCKMTWAKRKMWFKWGLKISALLYSHTGNIGRTVSTRGLQETTVHNAETQKSTNNTGRTLRNCGHSTLYRGC